MISAFVAALVGIMAAQASPGPNMMAVAGAGLAQGRGKALLVVSGIATGSLIWAVAAAFGLGELFRRFPPVLTVLTFLGGAYLLWLAVRALRTAWKGEERALRANSRLLTGFGAWRLGILVVLTNPKSALMWSAIATFLYGAKLPVLAMLAFGPVVALSAMLIYGTYGVIFSSRLAGQLYERFARAIEFVFGAAFGCLGVLLIAAGVRALRA